MGKRLSLTKSEKLTLILSVVALILSLLSTYYQFFFSSQELKATIAFAFFEGKQNDIPLQIAFINSGNQPALVFNVYPRAVDADGSKIGINSEKTPAELPAVVKQGEILLVKRIDTVDPASLYGLGVPPEPAVEGNNPDAHKVSLELHFSTMDSSGKLSEADFPIGYITIDQKRVIGGMFQTDKVMVLHK
jgi:hypothetical protein